MIALASFATGEFIAPQMELARSALQCGARRVSMWRREDLIGTAFYQENRDILDRPRGAGYWLWKPYIILRELERLDKGDFLIYCDTGPPHKTQIVKRPLSILTEWCREHRGGLLPGLYLPRYGSNTRWIKGECFAVMGCEAPLYKEHPQIQAGISVWEKHEASTALAAEWLRWASNPQALLDDQIDPTIPNAADFVEHRHDQAVLTLLVLKQGLKLVGSPLECHPAERRINSLIDRISGKLETESFAELFPSFAERYPALVEP